jgi:hypothetical protein
VWGSTARSCFSGFNLLPGSHLVLLCDGAMFVAPIGISSMPMHTLCRHADSHQPNPLGDSTAIGQPIKAVPRSFIMWTTVSQ